MGILGDIGKVYLGGLLGGPLGALKVFAVQYGGDTVEGVINWEQQFVKIKDDIYRAIPSWAYVLAGNPIAGLLKHEFEDEVILLGQLRADTLIYAGVKLFGRIDQRSLNDEEWEMARYIFRDSLYDRADILLTNLAGLGGRPFTIPLSPHGVPVLVNLGDDYRAGSTTADLALLYHELTHVWQAKQRVLQEIYVFDTVPDAQTAGAAYNFTSGRQWSEYGTEQQASIVEAWTSGATQKPLNLGARRKFALASPLFRYINGNVRRSDNEATTGDGHSVRQLLAEGGHRTVRDMYSNPP
jgi:hypothetical protein